jgi:hypothetical protein
MLRTLSFVLVSLVVVVAATAQTATANSTNAPPQLRLVPLLDGLLEDTKGDLAAIATTDVGKEAAKVGLDLAKPPNPFAVAGCKDGRLFYVFYKTTEEAFGDRAWMLQRIKKVERTWKTADAEPEEKVTFQVEAFKTIGGSLKGSDQHYGGYSLRGAHRREVVKEYEVGFAEVPGLAAGADWPFDRKRLFHMLQPYEADSSLFDRVKFHASRRWTLTATLASDGSHRVHSPELGLDLPKKPPTSDLAKVPADPASKALVLIAGEGLAGFAVGKSKREDVDKVLGAPLEYVPAGDNHNASYRGGLTCNFDATGVLNTVFTRASFAGRTKDGLQLGMTRDEVQKKLGKKQGDAAATWTLPGLVVKFDATGVVQRLVVTKG